MTNVSRTVGQDQLVDEVVINFTHTATIDWLLPGVPATGKGVEIAVAVIVGFKDGKISHEHIYWDQASVLVQIGLLNPVGLPFCPELGATALIPPELVQFALCEIPAGLPLIKTQLSGLHVGWPDSVFHPSKRQPWLHASHTNNTTHSVQIANSLTVKERYRHQQRLPTTRNATNTRVVLDSDYLCITSSFTLTTPRSTMPKVSAADPDRSTTQMERQKREHPTAHDGEERL
jgi:hypothetical protein